MRYTRTFLLLVMTAIVTIATTACSSDADPGGSTTSTTDAETPTTTEPTPPALEDGQWFAFVMVGRDETEEITLGVDLAELLTGEEARQAAIDAGVIGEDEDLPNDFFILNEAEKYELLHVADGAEFALISVDDTSQRVVVDVEEFEAIYNGNDTGQTVYGIPGGVPIAMDVTVSDGLVTEAEAVYFP